AEKTASPKAYVSGLLKRARAAREGPPGQSSPASPASQAYPLPPRSPRPTSGPGRYGEGAAELLAPRGPVTGHLPAPHPAEGWQRWELVPGVELHVRADAERRHRDLIRRLLADVRGYQEER